MSDPQSLIIPETIRLRHADGRVEEMTLDEYLKGVVPTEMGLQKPLEALKAQAVASRSFAVVTRRHAADGFDVCGTTHCQVYKPDKRYADSDRAVDETSGLVATYNGQIVSTSFFGHCDGHTRNSEDVWSGAVAYLRSVPCVCGYTTLYGHGVGMCQRGAAAMAGQQAATFEAIVQHYYTGCRVSRAEIVPRPALRHSLVFGRVTDGLDRPRAGLRLRLSGPSGSFDRGTTSDGRFWFTGLPAGHWELTVKDRPVRYAELYTDGRSSVQLVVAVPDVTGLDFCAAPLPGGQSGGRLAGTLGYSGVPVTVTDARGNELTVLSGSAPAYDPGGFEVPVLAAGAHRIRFLDRSFDLAVGDDGVWVQFKPIP